MFADAMEVILRDQCTSEAVRQLTTQPRDGTLWNVIANAGFLDLMRGIEDGGAGLALVETEELMKLIGYYGVPLPLAETIAACVLVGPKTQLPESRIALTVNVYESDDGSLYSPRVPYAAAADYVLGCLKNRLILLPCEVAQCGQPELPGNVTTSLRWPRGVGIDVDGDVASLVSMAIALTAAQMAGGMQRIMELTLDYCNARIQFGRTLGKFQTVQHQLSVMAEHTLATSIAVATAFRSGTRVPSRISAAMAKARASEAAIVVANIAHGLHGAIGVTEEYDLQLHTRRLHEGRLAHGSEKYWHKAVGEHFFKETFSAAEYVREVVHSSSGVDDHA